MEPQDKEVLAAVFASRVSLAKEDKQTVIDKAVLEWERTLLWIASNSQKEKSFLWFCDEFDLDAGAVRRAIEERR
jgi:hypothetical protein